MALSSVPVDPAEPEPSTSDGSGPAVEWSGLPEPVRARLAELGAAAVGALPQVDVPQALRAVARFAPAKRARLGGSAIVAGLRDVPAFRTAVVEWCRENRPAALDLGGDDPVAVAAAAVLLGEESAVHYLELVSRRASDTSLRAERDSAVTKLTKAESELERTKAQLAELTGAVDRVRAEGEVELERLRKRLREQGARLREARDAAAAAEDVVQRVRAETDTALAALTEQRDRERDRAETERHRAARAEADADIARQSAREARQADEVRLALLVDTLDGAVTGLRRELALGGGGPRPADMVRGATTAQGTVGRVEDPAALDRLLALPAVHLVVDGYNVTKTGYPDLSLADQRDRLVRQLASLAARTSAEVTLVFDGAGVVAVPVAAPRGVRVLFSDPGVLADDVIKALVTAEPEGRPVVVVTSDRAVADAVRRRGAHPVPSAVLLARLGRI
ncbi:NYN domain-containing protein [Actinokineospora enzanensis]|uniref:NYN domain-containing protein n=1 Tax=Actinokineospora enzanensis TaxID=155975 RepID=UPI0003659D8C|nr:NYN domain-containing protein [Actinokineospora enzanensis]